MNPGTMSVLRHAFFGLAAAILMFGFVACEKKLTQANHDKLAAGQTLGQVEAILGKGTRQEITGMSISGAGIAGGSTGSSLDTYVWKDGARELSVVFKEGKSISWNKNF